MWRMLFTQYALLLLGISGEAEKLLKKKMKSFV